MFVNHSLFEIRHLFSHFLKLLHCWLKDIYCSQTYFGLHLVSSYISYICSNIVKANNTNLPELYTRTQ